MPARKLFVVCSLAVLTLAACSSDEPSASPSQAPTTTTEPSPSAEPTETPSSGGGVEIEAEDSSLGTILTDSDGNTLYMFLNDTGSDSTCYDDCAANWPALTTDGAPEAGGSGGVDESLLGTTERTDGTTQVTYAGHPLYHFGGDQAAGDTNGQGVGQIWYVVSPEGTAIKN
jgi:predicted lipoprotein with Yx(FWY)xxD motif